VFYYHFVKWDILGIKKVHGFETDRFEESLIGESPQRGSARESLGEPSKLSSCGIWVTTALQKQFTPNCSVSIESMVPLIFF
jgi:hypothetical protein